MRSPATGAEAEILAAEREARERDQDAAQWWRAGRLEAYRALRHAALDQPNPTAAVRRTLTALAVMDAEAVR